MAASGSRRGKPEKVDLHTIRGSDRLNLEGSEVGDQVVMRHTKAVAISVENP